MTHPGVPPLPAILVPLALALCTSACLVTDKIEYGERNIPANLWSLSPPSFTRVPPTPDPRCSPSVDTADGGAELSADTPWMRFDVRVLDANVGDTLRGLMFVNRQQVIAGSINKIPVTGTEERDPLHFCLRQKDLRSPCNHVEFLVSRGFSLEAEDRSTPELEGDLAKLEWWVLGPAAKYPQVSASDCEGALPDGGAP